MNDVTITQRCNTKTYTTIKSPVMYLPIIYTNRVTDSQPHIIVRI